jgi:glycosyltransferase involved in cell wall biosynthesis
VPTPILILSDAVTCPSGLGRIARDLAIRINEMSEFRVATLGPSGIYSTKYPFPQYPVYSIERWIVHELPHAWADFAKDEKGIVLVIWDASRVGWMVDPPGYLGFADWLKARPFKLWTYSPVDAEGPHGLLTEELHNTLAKFDRVLNYTQFSANVTCHPDHLPHGIDTSVFYPRENAKQKFREYGYEGLTDESLLIGIVATNQTRKDWPLGIQAAAILRDRGHDVKLWCHTDVEKRHFDIPILMKDYGFEDLAPTTNKFPDAQMADLYSACDLTFGLGSEGFGYPLFESLACGTPVVHGNYAGGAEYVPKEMLVEPIGWRYDTVWCWKRAIYRPEDWADVAERVIGKPCALPEELDWNNLWEKWKQWLLEGLK